MCAYATRRHYAPAHNVVPPGPHAPIGRSSGPSAATPLTQLPFGSPPVAREQAGGELSSDEERFYEDAFYEQLKHEAADEYAIM